MTPKNTILVLTRLLVALPIALATNCPDEGDLAPYCTCKEFGRLGGEIQCHGIGDEDLAKVANTLKGMTVRSFTIEDSELGVIPHDIFKGVNLSELEITDSTLTTLTDTDEALVGLEDHLTALDITFCVYKNKWDWSVLRNLKKLKNLSILGTVQLETIGTDVMKASVSPSVEFIYLAMNNISSVTDRAFESYENLMSLTLSNNNIRNVKRTMLPNPALKLDSLNLRGNLIEQFPEDMFTNMPNLRRLDIGSNKILVLDEKTFSPVWEQLTSFYTSGNALHCDCRMSWLLEKKFPEWFGGRCKSPPELKRKNLNMLTSKDLRCHS